MRRAFFASALLLLLACSLAWGASSTDLKPLDGPQGSVPVTKPTPPPPPPPPPPACPVSCWLDPTITCTSQVGDCHHINAKGVEWLTCDGVTYLCPGF
jgi:hypothetical protein